MSGSDGIYNIWTLSCYFNWGVETSFPLDSINEGKNKLGFIWLKLKELIKLKDLIKILLSLIDLIEDFIGIKIKFESQFG
jgi:hypothetical protein